MPTDWAVVLGVSSGFGAEAARAFALQGWGVFGVHLDRRGAQPAVDALKTELEGCGVPVHFVNGNAASESVRDEAIQVFSERMAQDDRVRVLLHSLAFGTLQPFIDEPPLKPRQMDMTLDVMAHSLVYWTREFVQRSWLSEGGRVFAMTSAGSLVAWPSYGAVSAAKAALESHIRQIAVELAPRGITANAIMAGVTDTPALRKIPGADRLLERAKQGNPHQRLTTPDDIARCLVSLCDPGTSWMTGNVLRVDGGESIAG